MFVEGRKLQIHSRYMQFRQNYNRMCLYVKDFQSLSWSLILFTIQDATPILTPILKIIFLTKVQIILQPLSVIKWSFSGISFRTKSASYRDFSSEGICFICNYPALCIIFKLWSYAARKIIKYWIFRGKISIIWKII